MWPRTNFLELLGLTHPIVQAPMSGFTPPALAAAVCNSGGLGSIGCAGQPSNLLREQVAVMRQTTNRPTTDLVRPSPSSTSLQRGGWRRLAVSIGFQRSQLVRARGIGPSTPCG